MPVRAVVKTLIAATGWYGLAPRTATRVLPIAMPPMPCAARIVRFSAADSIIDAGEECDDGNDINDDDCANACTLNLCGNGRQDPGELCDDGEENSDVTANACRTDCSQPRCGDGVMDAGEECDDGNTENGDSAMIPCESVPLLFSTCGHSGRIGPSFGDCANSYAGTALADSVNVSAGIQQWIVPQTGRYQIMAAGASGNQSTAGKKFGTGAVMRGDFRASPKVRH